MKQVAAISMIIGVLLFLVGCTQQQTEMKEMPSGGESMEAGEAASDQEINAQLDEIDQGLQDLEDLDDLQGIESDLDQLDQNLE